MKVKNVIKKYKLEAIKNIGIKKSDNILGDVFGVVNKYLKEGDEENAETVALTVKFTIDEILEFIDEAEAKFIEGDSLKVIKGELVKTKELIGYVAASIELQGGKD